MSNNVYQTPQSPMDSEFRPNNQYNESFKNYTLITYLAYIIGAVFSMGMLTFVGVIMAYVKRSDMEGTLYHTHMQFLIRTFWFSLLGLVIGVITMFILVGFLIFFLVSIWFIYRVIFGLVRLMDNRPVDPYRWIEL